MPLRRGPVTAFPPDGLAARVKGVRVVPDSDDSASGDAPRIFFSYASEDRYWVDAFKDPTWFGAVGNVKILDYSAEQVGYGQLKDALDQQICRAAGGLGFVTNDYSKKQWTVAAWEQ